MKPMDITQGDIHEASISACVILSSACFWGVGCLGFSASAGIPRGLASLARAP